MKKIIYYLVHFSNLVERVMLVLNNFDTGQVSLAVLAAFSKVAWSAPNLIRSMMSETYQESLLQHPNEYR